MKRDYWEVFTHTGRVEDYLHYKDVTESSYAPCGSWEERAGVDRSERDNHSNRDGTDNITHR